MTSYAGLHVNCSDAKVVAEAIVDYESRVAKRSATYVDMTPAGVARLFDSGHLYKKYFVVKPACDGWVETVLTCNNWRAAELADRISSQMSCMSVLLGYQTTVGQTFFRLSEAGACRRKLWYTRGEPVHEEAGSPLEFEAKYRDENMASLERDEREEIDEMDEDAKRTMSLPDCEAFAEALGCNSFFARGLDVNGTPAIFVIKSRPKWMFWG